MPASNLSANTLFHFTKSLENIKSILENNFYPRYCIENLEDFIPKEYEKKLGIPMVCFCDIPLAQIKNHRNLYGNYAIGLSKDWAKKVGINPIMYIEDESNASSLIRQAIYKLNDSTVKDKRIETSSVYGDMLQFVTYLKKYESNNWDGTDFNGEKIRFYDEREWRYVPPYTLFKAETDGFFITRNQFVDLDTRNKYNKILEENCTLKFEPRDIKYIIVEDEKDVLEIEKEISRIFGHKEYYDQVRLLKTRIITMKQILEDF